MRFALVDSGLGVLPAAMHLRRLCPSAELILSMDPEGMPWGARTPDDIAERALACAEATLPWAPDVLVLACNTASVRALDLLRSEFEPDLPVVGTVPAIKPAAASGDPVAIWATAATTGSPYQQELIRQFADGVPVTEVACPGLADAIERADQEAIAAAVLAAASATSADTRAIVLGCTQYELVMDRIRGALPRVRLHGSAPAVAAQAFRRLAARPAGAADAVAIAQHAASGSADPSRASGAATPGGNASPADPGQHTPSTHPGRHTPDPGGHTVYAARGRHAPPENPGGRHAPPENIGGHPPSPDPGWHTPSPEPGWRTPYPGRGRHAPPTGPTEQATPSGSPRQEPPDGSADSSNSASSAGPAGPAGPAGNDLRGSDMGASVLQVLLSGAPGELPPAALRYAEGRLLAGLRLPSTAA